MKRKPEIYDCLWRERLSGSGSGGGGGGGRERNGSESRTMKNTEENEMKSVELGTDLTSFPLDRISKLPDDILVDILSNLELRESAKTSVLSRRWFNLWTLVPRLHFDANKDQRENRTVNQRKQDWSDFVNWVNHVLGLHKSSYLREFRIFFEFQSYSCNQNEIDKWLEYAFGRGVETLELNFSRYDCDVSNKFSYILTNRVLERIAPRFGFSRVRALCFSVVNISGEAIEFLLRKCPLLEDLRVVGSNVLVNLVVSGPSLLLKHLQITACYRFESITISDTNIVSLRVSTIEEGHLFLNNLPMLTDVWIHDDEFSNKNVLFSQISCCLPQLTVLTLQAAFLQDTMENYKLPELHYLRRLVLSTSSYAERSMIGLTSLIDSCPRLEEFALMLKVTYVSMRNIEQKKAMKQSLKGLRVFELYGYRGSYESESELIMFFIENAVALEKIIIDPRKVTFHHGSEPAETEQAKEYRKNAIEKFEGVVPKHVQLVIL